MNKVYIIIGSKNIVNLLNFIIRGIKNVLIILLHNVKNIKIYMFVLNVKIC
jgi:hypothetical protein